MDREHVRTARLDRARADGGRRFALPPRAEDFVCRDLGDEIIIVDENSQKAHCLSGLSAHVWRAAGGGAWPKASRDEIAAVTDELTRLGLMVEPVGMTRRSLLARSGVVVAATGIVSVGLPEAAAHASATVTRTRNAANTYTI